MKKWLKQNKKTMILVIVFAVIVAGVLDFMFHGLLYTFLFGK